MIMQEVQQVAEKFFAESPWLSRVPEKEHWQMKIDKISILI